MSAAAVPETRLKAPRGIHVVETMISVREAVHLDTNSLSMIHHQFEIAISIPFNDPSL
jgi:hypothetical protein